MWNKQTKKWAEVTGVKYIVINVCTEEFKLDNVPYDTNEWELNFIHGNKDWDGNLLKKE